MRVGITSTKHIERFYPERSVSAMKIHFLILFLSISFEHPAIPYAVEEIIYFPAYSSHCLVCGSAY